MAALIALRPDLDQNVDALPLYITGVLPVGKPGLAYEGRLQIRNAHGACTVEQLGGDALPPGGSISVDPSTMEIVVAWPEYAEYVTPLQNPGFESGNLTGWTLTQKGGSATATADTSQKFDGAYSLRWPGGKGLGSEGGIEVEAWNNTIGPCLPGQRVTTHARCMYNPAGHNFGNRYQGLLRFVDGAGVPIAPILRGKLFKGRGENGRWNDASATGIGPAGTKGVQLGAWMTGSNAPVWLDVASWDVPSSIGINIEATLQLTLRVRDSAGRSALWSGFINVSGGYWFFGPTSASATPGVGGTSHYMRSRTPDSWGEAPVRAPHAMLSISRISTANGVVFLHGSPAASMSRDHGTTWLPCSNALSTAADVYWNGSHYYQGALRSLDGESWELIPNLSFVPTSVIARVSDGAVVAYTTSSGGSGVISHSLDNCATWIDIPRSSSMDISTCTDGDQIWLTINSSSGRRTGDFGATLVSYTGGPSAYSTYWEDGVLLIKSANDVRRSENYGALSIVGTFDTGGRSDPMIVGVGDLWVIAEKKSGSINPIRVSIDRGITFGSPVVTLGGNGGNICFSGKEDP